MSDFNQIAWLAIFLLIFVGLPISFFIGAACGYRGGRRDMAAEALVWLKTRTDLK